MIIQHSHFKAALSRHQGAPVTLILDNARYQRCKAVAAHAARAEIELLYLPSYSPNLNLIERLWKLTKKKCLTNRHHPTFGEFRAAIDDCLRKMACRNSKVCSPSTSRFSLFTNPHDAWYILF